MRISDGSSDVCSSDLLRDGDVINGVEVGSITDDVVADADPDRASRVDFHHAAESAIELRLPRSEEHTSELQSLMRISYAVFCLKKKIIIFTLSPLIILTTSLFYMFIYSTSLLL